MAKARRSKRKNKSKLDLQVVTLIVASILLAILIYTKSGYIGENLSPVLGGIMGWIKYLIPIGLFGVAIFIAKEEDKDDFNNKIIQYLIFLACITTVITVIHAYKGGIYIEGKFDEVIEQSYYQGTRNEGGGVIGAFFAFGLSKLLRKIRSNNCYNRNSFN